MEKKWIKTELMLEILKGEPDVEQQYCHHLGGILRSTHWLEYSSKRNQYGESTNWFNYTWYTESEFLEIHAGEWWMREIWDGGLFIWLFRIAMRILFPTPMA